MLVIWLETVPSGNEAVMLAMRFRVLSTALRNVLEVEMSTTENTR